MQKYNDSLLFYCENEGQNQVTYLSKIDYKTLSTVLERIINSVV